MELYNQQHGQRGVKHRKTSEKMEKQDADAFTALTLGARLDKTKSGDSDLLNPKHLYVVCGSLFFCLMLVNSMCYLVVRFAIDQQPLSGSSPQGIEVTTDAQVYQSRQNEISISTTILSLQDWLENEGTTITDTSASRYEKSTAAEQCIRHLREALVDAGEVTSPRLIEAILKRMGLLDRPTIQRHLHDLLMYPQPIAPLLDESFNCSATSLVLSDVACLLMGGAFPVQSWYGTDAGKSSLLEALHISVVFEALIKVMTVDMAALHDVLHVMEQRFSHDTLFGNLTASPRDRLPQNTYASVETLKNLGMALAENRHLSLRMNLQSQILQRVQTLLALGHHDYALVGMALASAVYFDATVEAHRMSWPLGQDWAEAYIAWNVASLAETTPFGMREEDSSLASSMPMLLLPMMTVCPSSRNNYADGFVTSQLIAQSLASLVFTTLDTNDDSGQYGSESSQQTLAENIRGSLIQNARLSIPGNAGIVTMLDELCEEHNCQARQDYRSSARKNVENNNNWRVTDTVPTSNLDEAQFQVYMGSILWVTVLFAGLGLELLMWTSFLHQDSWSNERQVQWKFAQFSFPLLLTITLGLALHRNFMALLFLVPGLWKFGFPETLVYMHTAIYGTYLDKQGHPGLIQRIAEFINAVGTVIHHGAAALVICMLLAGVITPSRHIISPSLILVMQHWFVLLRYSSKVLYTILELLLEVYFEWTVISEFQYMLAMHWCVPVACASMLVAHWLYLLAAIAEIIKPCGGDLEEQELQRFSNFTQETKDSWDSALNSVIRVHKMNDNSMMSSMRSISFVDDQKDHMRRRENNELHHNDKMMFSATSLQLDDILEGDDSTESQGNLKGGPETDDDSDSIYIDFRSLNFNGLLSLTPNDKTKNQVEQDGSNASYTISV